MHATIVKRKQIEYNGYVRGFFSLAKGHWPTSAPTNCSSVGTSARCFYVTRIYILYSLAPRTKAELCIWILLSHYQVHVCSQMTTFTWHTNNRNDSDLLHRIHQHMTNGNAVANELSPKEIKNSFTQAAHPTD